MDFLNNTFLNDPISDWLVALAIFVAFYTGIVLLGTFIKRRMLSTQAEKVKPGHLLAVELITRTSKTAIFLVALYFASRWLVLTPTIHRLTDILAIIAVILQATFWGLAMIDYWVAQRTRIEPGEEAARATTLGALNLIAKIILWSLAILLILQNVTGMDLNALVAALGVGGIAVALAVQNILSDLFSSVSIALDKPFVLGDDIAVGDLRGTVEYIGLKSTRLRSFTGEQIVLSNSDLLSSRIHNFQRLERRRVSLVIYISLQTPYDKLVRIPAILQESIETQTQITFGQAFFREYSAFALVFECIYFVETPEFQVHRDRLHAINLEIYQHFAAEGIELANISGSALVGTNAGL